MIKIRDLAWKKLGEVKREQTTELLNNTGKAIRTLQTKLEKLFTKGSQIQKKIVPGDIVTMDVEPDQTLSAYVVLQESLSSLLFTLTPIGLSGNVNPDIKVWMSLSSKEPNEFN